MQPNNTYAIRVNTGYITNAVGISISCGSIDEAVNYVLKNDFIPLTDCTHNAYYIGEANTKAPAYLYFTFVAANDKYYLNVKSPKLNIENNYEIAKVDNKWSLV